jgi:tetratricopeptide (TPR) repeat protein
MSTTPPPALFFYGRNEYVLHLVQLIKRGQERALASRLIINGPGGIGKTSIATALLHHPDIKALFTDRIYFASCEAVSSETLLVEAIASSLSLGEVPGDMLSKIISFIRSASCPVFLVLDNFETCWSSDRRREIHLVLKHLATLDNLTLLLTMRVRDEPPEIRWERLPELTVLKLEDARKLFLDIAEIKLPLDPPVGTLVDELLQAQDCLPLAVTLLAQLVRQGESIPTLHRRWQLQKTGLLTIGKDNRHYSLDASVKLSLDSTPMKNDEIAKRLLRILSYLPDGLPAGSLEELTSLFSILEVYQASYTLRSVSLAYQDVTGTLRSLSPIRHHVAGYDPLKTTECDAIKNYYVGLAGLAEKTVNQEVDVYETARQLRPQLGNLHFALGEVAKASSVSEDASEAILQMTKFMYQYASPSSDLLTNLLANKHFKPSDHFVAESNYMIGMVHHLLSRFGPALDALTKAANLFASLKSARRLAACEWTKGNILRVQCRYPEAKKVLEKARGAYAALKDPMEANDGVAICLWDLAGIAEVQGRYAEARSTLQRARGLADPRDFSLHAICRMTLASIDIEQGEYQKAASALQDILTECRATDDSHDIGHCLYRLAEAVLRLEKYDEVKVYALEGREIGKTEIRANCIRSLGYVALHDKAYDASEKLFSESLAAAEGYGDRLSVADTKLGLARLLFQKEENAEAESLLGDLLTEYEAMGCPRGKGQVYILLAKILQEDPTRIDHAMDQLKQAKAIFTHLENSSEIEKCQTLMSNLKLCPSIPVH